jgi:hypothetical protein
MKSGMNSAKGQALPGKPDGKYGRWNISFIDLGQKPDSLPEAIADAVNTAKTEGCSYCPAWSGGAAVY